MKPTTNPWRDRLREVRRLAREAGKARGKRRRILLILAAKIIVALREPRAERAAFDRAERKAEVLIGRLAHACVGCLAMEPTDGDSADGRDVAHS